MDTSNTTAYTFILCTRWLLSLNVKYINMESQKQCSGLLTCYGYKWNHNIKSLTHYNFVRKMPVSHESNVTCSITYVFYDAYVTQKLFPFCMHICIKYKKVFVGLARLLIRRNALIVRCMLRWIGSKSVLLLSLFLYVIFKNVVTPLRNSSVAG